ncbi:MAG: nickel-type superoxide dismutase maturation protease [Chloroflexi bacterium]|nr:nickel-type superoxide dismutase maturation protease [Chloroflexota bacterium]
MTDLPQSNAAELLRWLLRRRRRFRVTGDSMLPLLQPGDEVLVDTHAYRQRPPAPGDLVVARHPYQTGVKLVKRVQDVDEHGRCLLTGDNPLYSSDSRAFGRIAPENILGRVTSRFG